MNKNETGLAALKNAILKQRMQKSAANASAPTLARDLPISHVDRCAALPLSWAQQRLWFLDQLDHAGGAAYHMPAALRLRGGLDKAALQAALDRIMARHEALRTTFDRVDGEPVQVIAPPTAGFALRQHDLSALAGAEQAAAVARLATEEVSHPFDLASGPLIRGQLLCLGEQEHVLLITQHHIISDGWSIGVLVREVTNLYAAFSQGLPDPLAPLAIQYADYSAWQRAWLQGETLQAQRDFWLEQLGGAPALLELPTDRPRPLVQSHAGAAVPVVIAPAQTAALRALAQRHGCTVFMTLLAAWSVLMSRLSGQDDIVTGTPVANRQRRELEPLIGLFVNTLALRVKLEGDPSVSQLLANVRASTLAAYSHADLPFEQVVEVIKPPRSLAHSPLFQTLLTVSNMPNSADSVLTGLTITPVKQAHTSIQFDLALSVNDTGTQIGGKLEYSSGLFDPTSAERIAEHFQCVLAGMLADENARCSELHLLTADQRHTLLTEFNNTDVAWPAPEFVHQQFETLAQTQPDAMAVMMDGAQLSYAELNSRANQLANRLIGLGTRLDERVAIYLERSIDMLVAILGVLKAGAAYVPLDSSYPEERLAFMLDDSAPRLVITQRELCTSLPSRQLLQIVLDSDAEMAALAALPIENPVPGVLGLDSSNLAYVIYTSGSTGTPKGVMVEHQSLCASIRARARIYGSYPRFLLFSAVAFDMSVAGIFGTLCHGGGLVILDRANGQDPRLVAAAIREHRITTLLCIPSFAQLLVDDLISAGHGELATIIVAGEACPVMLVSSIAGMTPAISLYNEYGPTESTVWATVHICVDTPSHIAVSIGRPIANTQIYILDGQRQPVPIGVTGELYIGGAGLARGYLNRPELSAERFVDNPFAPGARLYRTGDLGRWRADGTIDYVGRNDFQVKLRGFRIELGEIEAKLRACTGVRDSIVALREDGNGDKRLVAYLIPTQEGSVSVKAVREQLAGSLAEYMIPSAFVELAQFPLTPNGKLDRAALPAPGMAAVAQRDYAAPEGELEAAIAAIWQGLLGLPRVSRWDNFFELGGHSLLAVQLRARLEQTLQVDVSLRQIFAQANLANLAALVADAKPALHKHIAPADRSVALPLSWAQQRLWFLDQLDHAAGVAYHMPAALRLQGNLDKAALQAALDRIVARHETLRTTFVRVDGEPVQVIAPPTAGFALRQHDLSALAGAEQEAAVARLATDEVSQPFDLASGPLIRGQLLCLGAQEHVLLITQHHIISDGWSIGVLVREVSSLYAAFSQGQPDPLPPLAIQYADYSAWQRAWLQGETLQAQRDFWLEQLGGAPALLELPTDRPRPPVQSHAGAAVPVVIAPAQTAALRALAQRHGCTVFMTLLAAWSVLMARLSGQDDVVTGTPVANRQRRELEPLIGLFVNTLALRVKLDGDPSVAQLLAQVRASTLAAYSHADLPFEQVVEVIKPPRSLAHSPVFQAMLSLNNTPDHGPLSLSGLTIDAVEQAQATTQFDLTLSLREGDAIIAGNLDYASDLFDAITAERIVAGFQVLLASMAEADAAHQVSRLALLPAPALQQVLEAFNDTARDYPAPALVHQLFEAQARARPDAIAVQAGASHLSYGELNRRANQLAHYLTGQGIGRDARVALCVERGIDMLVGVLGILKAGAAYVPLDPAFPAERLAYMLEDSAPAALVTQRALAELGAALAAPVLVLDAAADMALLAAQSETDPDASTLGLAEAQLAYVIYTSGSTGKPKGVMIEHRSVVNFLHSMSEAPGMGRDDVLLAVTTLSFDIAGLELYLPLMHGARVILAARGETMDPVFLAQAIEREAVTVMQATPATWQLLLDSGWKGSSRLRALCGGEALTAALAARLLGCTESVWNLYGPTETTIWSACRQVRQDDRHAGGVVSIGRPIANTQIYILDGQHQPVPIGVTGELYIGGAGLARGYLNRPELSAERFVDNPFAPGTRLYRTGDLGRWRADGTIDYVGRNDFQVKLRGFRIELGEIEAKLRACAGVSDSVVALREDGNGDKRLAAYLIGDETAARDNKMAFSLFYFGADNYAHSNKYKLFLKAAKFADENGFEAVWTPERHFNEVGALYPNPALLSGALATITQNVHLRAGSVVSPLHHPVRIAEEWSVVDNLSAGRIGISLASGWHPRDFILAPENFSGRKEIMGQHVDTLRALWSGAAVAFEGGNGKSVPIQLFPAPVQSQLPLWITSAGNPETFAMAGRLGTNVLTHLLGQNIEDVAKNISIYRAALAEHGFDPAAGKITLMIHTFVGEDFDATLERARKPFQDYMRAHLGLLKPLLKTLDVPVDEVSEEHVEGITAFAFERYSRHASLIGTVQSCLPVLNALRAAGVDEVACLIDWMNGEDALSGLQHLQRLHASSWKTVHDPKLLLAQLKTSMPDYMLPSSFTFLDSFPLTPNGKLDRKALPAPDMGAVSTFRYEAPRPGIEQRIAEIWSGLLNVERVGRNDNFFELGGHSLMVVSLIERLRQQGMNADVRTMFAASTLAELAERIQHTDLDAAPFVTPPNPITPDTTVLQPDLLPLVDLTQEEIDRIVAHSPGAVSNIQDIYPLAPLQQGMLFHHLLTPEGDAYLSATIMSFDKRERLDSFLGALQGVIDRHDILRTSLYWEGVRQPVQIVYRKAPLVVHELAIGPGENALETLRLRTDPHRVRIDMQRAPLLLAYVAREPESDTFYLSLLNHHMVCDHVTLRFVLAEIEQLLRSNAKSLPNSLPYRNFIAQTTRVPESEHVNYFRNLLGDVERPTVLYGLTNVRGNGSGVRGAKQVLDAALATRIRSVARAHSVTPAVLFHVAWAMVLGQCSGSDDVMFGTVLSGRMQGTEGADVVLGMFINTLPVRVRIGERPLREVVETTYAQLSALLMHEQTTLALIQRCSKVPVSAPLFTALFNYRHTKDQAGDSERAVLWDGVSTLGSVERTNYPISIAVDDLGQGFSMTSLCDGVDPELLLGYLNAAIHNLTMALDDNQDTSISRLGILPDQERRKVVVDFNRTAQAFSSDLLAHQVFESQVEIMGEAPAIIYGDVVLSYRELNSRANQLAHYLIGLGVQPDERVAICAPRSLEMIVAMLAVLKSGAAYVPLDPAMPDERLSFMIKDSTARILLTQHAQCERFDGLNSLDSTIVLLDRPGEDVAAMSHDNPRPAALHAGSLAYVIYTSGSTGLPKGVMVQHDGLRNYLQWAIGHYGEEGVCHSIVSSPFAFDATITSLYTPLLTGGNTVLVPEGQELSMLAAMLRQDSVRRLIKITPAHLRVLGEQLGAEGIRPSRHLYVVGGESLPLSTVAMWHNLSPDSRVINEYGPTETVVGCCVYEANDGELSVLENMPIGRPIANTQMYILDNYLRPTPIGVPGEIYIGGAGVARGYLQRPELTTRHFVDDPFGDSPQGRLYRTGDLARWLDDGNIDYLGRNDFQVKIRGFRIEIGEVETALNACAEIHHAIVIARETSPGDKRLVAYLIKRDGVELDIAALRSKLALRLADYMIPSAFVCVESFPLTANGKLDRAALPAPDLSSVAAREYEPPTGAVEIALAKIWHDVLKIDHFGRHDEFFELGGHSLLAVQVAIKIRDIFSVDVPLAKIFEHTSLASLSELIMSMKLVQFEQGDIQSEAADIDQLSEEELLALLEQERALMRT